VLAVKLLLAFQKGEALRHLGHLDLQRAMQRALRRSGLPVRYSQGFHPHMLTAFASALAMGVSSDEEIMEAGLTEPVSEADCLARMNAALPEALRASRAVLVEDARPALMSMLRQAGYSVCLAGADAGALSAAAEAFLQETEVMALRVSKSGERMVNIRPMAHALSVTQVPQLEGGARTEIRMRLSLEETATLKPELLVSTLWERAGLPREAMPALRLRRTGLFGQRDGRAVPLMDL